MKGLSAPLEIAWVATFFIWMVLLLVGPLRGLIVGMQGNALVVGYRHLPIAERLRQWEVWMALPLIAYLLSILSGLGVSLLMEPQPGWGMVCLGSGVMVLYYFGLFWGMQDHGKEVTLQDVTDPGVFLAEIKGRALAGRLEAIDLSEVLRQRPNLRLTDEPVWQCRIRLALSRRHQLQPLPGPARGVGIWRNGAGDRVRIRVAFIATMLVRRWWFWAEIVVTSALVVLGATIYLDQPRDSVDPSPMRMVAFDAALVLVTMAVSWSAARAAIIYGVRLRLAEQDQLAQVDAVIHGSMTPDPSSGPGDSLWRELLLVAARHVNRRQST